MMSRADLRRRSSLRRVEIWDRQAIRKPLTAPMPHRPMASLRKKSKINDAARRRLRQGAQSRFRLCVEVCSRQARQGDRKGRVEREDDLPAGWYRPMWHDRFAAGWTPRATIAWTHTIVGQSLRALPSNLRSQGRSGLRSVKAMRPSLRHYEFAGGLAHAKIGPVVRCSGGVCRVIPPPDFL